MTNVRGELELTARGRTYKLWLGMSVLADLQREFGQDVIEQLEPPEGASKGWMPDLNIVTSVFLGSLQRYHAAEADRWLVDDLLVENDGALVRLIGSSMPEDKEPARGNAKRPRRTA